MKNYCFEAGTLVETENGKKPIEEIEVGEYVYAKNLETGEVEPCKVVGTSEKESQFMVRIKAAEEAIYATPNHCFYIEGKGWIEAGDIRVGDLLVLQDGEQIAVESIKYEVLETPIKVYNLTVEGLHNYYVGGIGVLYEGNNISDKLKNIYNSIKQAPKYPTEFKPKQNGTKKVNINNSEVLDALRQIEPGQWKKVYKDGFDGSGNKISIHYFESPSGKVFDVKVKNKWSN